MKRYASAAAKWLVEHPNTRRNAYESQALLVVTLVGRGCARAGSLRWQRWLTTGGLGDRNPGACTHGHPGGCATQHPSGKPSDDKHNGDAWYDHHDPHGCHDPYDSDDRYHYNRGDARRSAEQRQGDCYLAWRRARGER